MLARFFQSRAFIKSINPKSLQYSTTFSVQTASKKGPPEEFFDEDSENNKAFLESFVSVSNGGLDRMTAIKENITWEQIENAKSGQLNFNIKESNDSDPLGAGSVFDHRRNFLDTEQNKFIMNSLSTNGNYPNSFIRSSFKPVHALNYNLEFESDVSDKNHVLHKFVPKKYREKYTSLTQGYRACEGQKQRKGKAGILSCHKIDLDQLHYLDIMNLRRFMSEDGEILSRESTGLCAKCQRNVSKTIKRARNLGILPRFGVYKIKEVKPTLESKESYHNVKIDKIVQIKSI